MNKKLARITHLGVYQLFKNTQSNCGKPIFKLSDLLFLFAIGSLSFSTNVWPKGIVKVTNGAGRVIEEYLDPALDNQIIYIQKAKIQGKRTKKTISRKSVTSEQIEDYIQSHKIPANGKKIKYEITDSTVRAKMNISFLEVVPLELWSQIFDQLNPSQLSTINRCTKEPIPFVGELYKEKTISEIREQAKHGRFKAAAIQGQFGGFVIQKNGKVKFFGEVAITDKIKDRLDKEFVKYGSVINGGFSFVLSDDSTLQWRFNQIRDLNEELKTQLNKRRILKSEWHSYGEEHHILDDGSILKRILYGHYTEVKPPENDHPVSANNPFIILESGNVILEFGTIIPIEPAKLARIQELNLNAVESISKNNIHNRFSILFKDGSFLILDDDYDPRPLPEHIYKKILESKAVHISIGGLETLVLFEDGSVECITESDIHTPCQLPEEYRNERFVSVSAGNGYNLGILENGKTVLWHTTPELAANFEKEKLPDDLLPVF